MIPSIGTLIIYIGLIDIVKALNPAEISTFSGESDPSSDCIPNHGELANTEMPPKSFKTIEHLFLFKTKHTNDSNEINTTYDLIKSNKTYVLNFKDEVKCVEVMCLKCQTIWKSKPSPNSSPNSGQDPSNLDFLSNDSDSISYEFLIKTEKDEKPSNDDDYNYDMRKSGTTYALNFKNDVSCVEAKYCTISTIWTKDPNVYWKQDLKSISYNTENERTFVKLYGDEFYENSANQSDIFESTPFPDYDLSLYTSVSLDNYPLTSQETYVEANSADTNNPETCTNPDNCSVTYQNESDNGNQTLDQNNIYDSSSMPVDITGSDNFSACQLQSDVFV
ncbi:hypothetical protein MACK_004119 [Theileria orientalis]|uniref:Uncharacterized protein n=1 Tax=Theileria orientalis TaxID=68886 RepID=A0A976SJV4_THEOR|nr:hypothetical protein MACK_004119 [Theileria orientalis]